MRQLIFSFIILSFTFLACKENTKSTSETTTSEVPNANATTTEITATTLPQENAVIPAPTSNPVTAAPATNTATPAPQPAAKQEPAQNAKGVWHFTCPKGCKGGGGAVGPCGKCGATLAHNAAYHEGAPTPAPTVTNGSTANAAPIITPVTQPTQKVEPPQNAKGVWHFTCAKGCAGGAGAAGTCAKCGGALAHNAAYHQ